MWMSFGTATGVQGLARVEPFLYDMAREVKQADLVVCRAGATTIAELTAASRPAIFIPLPTAADDHQRLNAEVVAAAGAAEVLEQRVLTGERLADRIAALAVDDAKRQAMAEAAGRLAHPDAAAVIVQRVLALAEKVADAMLGRTRRIHFVGDRRDRDERYRRAAREPRIRGERVGPQGVGRDRPPGDARRADCAGPRGRARRRRRRGRRVVRGARHESRSGGGAGARDSGDSARGDARRADAAALRDRHRGRARKDDDDFDGRAGARAGGSGPDGRHRRAAERLRQQRAARDAASTSSRRRTRAIGRS